MLVHVKMIQFTFQFPCQLESAKKTVHRALLCNQALCVHDPQNQLSLEFFQTLDELPVTSFDFLLRFLHRQRGVKSVIQ